MARRILPYDVATAVDSMRRNRGRTMLTVLTVMAPLYILGAFAAVGLLAAPYVRTLAREARLVVYLRDGCTDGERAALEKALAPPDVVAFHYVSPAEARRRLGGMMGPKAGSAPSADPSSQLPDDALPASYEVTLARGAAARSEEVARRLGKAPGVAEVADTSILTRRLSVLLTAFTGVGAFLAVILSVAAMVTVSNTVRLVFQGRRDEVGILKLVGATDDFVRGPFLVEGALLGTLGGLAACLALLATRALAAFLARRWGGPLSEVAYAVGLTPLVLFALPPAGFAIGVASSWLALRGLLSAADEG